MNLEDITPVVLTWNEAPNIQQCLEPLSAFDRVVIVDSGSTDETTGIVASFKNASLHPREFDDHTNQWNHGIDLVETPWVLSLDADYLVTEAGLEEIGRLDPGDLVSAYDAPFRYRIFDTLLRGSLYPPRAVLFRKDRARYVPDGHTQLLEVDGETASLREPIIHDDRKPLGRWIDSQKKYAALEAEKLEQADHSGLGFVDRLRKMAWPAPFLTLLYCLFRKGLLFQGRAGWYYTLQRTIAEILLCLNLLDRKLRR